jgi:hypothetical protein
MRCMSLVLAAALAGAVVAGCEEKKPTAPATGSKTAAPVQPASGGRGGEAPMAGAPAAEGQLNVANIRVDIPEGWRQVPVGNPMRLAELEAPGNVIAVFSTAQGGVQANLDRWAGQFSGGGEPKFEERSVGSLTVHVAQASGTYRNMGDPPLENQALRGAVVETPAGLVFIKMTGPAEAVEAAEEGFNSMVGSIELAN